MPITVRWDNKARTIARWTFQGDWTWQDMQRAQAEFAALMNDIAHGVDIIADVSHTATVPDDAFANFRALESNVHPLRNRVILVGANMLLRSMAATFNRLFSSQSTHFLFANTIEEAHARLR